MCNILAPTNWELLKYYQKLFFSHQAAENYAQQLIWKKLFNSLGDNLSNNIDEFSNILLSIWAEEDESEISYLDQAVDCFFLNGFENNELVLLKRQTVEAILIDLLRHEIYSAYLGNFNTQTQKILIKNRLVAV
jgi:hypothetical protein